MCGESEGHDLSGHAQAHAFATAPGRGAVSTIEDLIPYAQRIMGQEQLRRSAAGFVGYGGIEAGDRILVGVDNHYSRVVVDAVVEALRRAGARVTVVETDLGPDREFDEVDEIRAIVRRESFLDAPRRWEGARWIEEQALRDKYDLLVLGKGGGPPAADGPFPTPPRYESIPWLQPEHLTSEANTYPLELHKRINEKTWAPIAELGHGGRVHLTDPEGTDLTWSLPEEGWAPGAAFGRRIHWGHLHTHTTTPVPEHADATGVVAGTTSHFSRPFPQLRLEIERGKVVSIEGGGGYGEAWRELDEETGDVHYPVFPRPGLFWMVEAAIGTNPKIARAPDIRLLSSGGTEWERRRAGIIHLGFGTFWRDDGERWAMDQGIAYGHLHVHLLFATLDVTTASGETHRIIDAGRLTAMDDPEIVALAEQLGSPAELLTESWTPSVPGITAPGSLDEYLADPARFIYRS
jgi:hypothetical protein